MGPKTSCGPCKPKWQDYLIEGIILREKGNWEDLYKSVEFLTISAEDAPTVADRRNAQNHLGLAYYHLGDYETAADIWNMVYTLSKVLPEVQTPPFLYQMSVALRNLSRKELCENEKDFEEAVGMANKARRMALNLNRHDLAWFTHGLFSAKLAYMKSIKSNDEMVLKELVKIEKNELFKFWKEVSKLERGVWLGALLMDYAVVYHKVSKPLLKIARFISRVLKLRRREEQITKLLSELS